MKTIVLSWLCPKDSASRARACLLIVSIAFFLLNSNKVEAQDIQILNPSFEGIPKEATVPSGWYKAEKSADTHPGACCKVDMVPSDGKTYVGAIANSKFAEGIGQKLSTPLKAGHIYAISVDLAYSSKYYNIALCEGTFAVYGSNNPNIREETLWQSKGFAHNDWKRYNILFTPSQDYAYLILGPYFEESCGESYSNVLIDNLSDSIREVPQLEVSVRSTCKGDSNGVAIIKVKDGEAPYSYLWQPGNYTGSSVANLRSGTYEVTVTSSNGTSNKTKFRIEEYDVVAKASIIDMGCHGDNNARITLNASGGKSPYLYSIDGGVMFQPSPVFENLHANFYNAIIKDSFNCIVNIGNLQVTDPEPLRQENVLVTSVSCSDVQNGKIIITPTGGTPPYIYSIPGYKSQSENIFTQLDAGQYHYRITDSHDCSIDGDATITKEWRDCAVFVPNAFSPNNDGINDLFRAKVNDDVHDFRMAIYGRWGQLIFETRDPEKAWNGTQKEVALPAGSYVWVITYTDSKQQAMKQQGSLVLIR